MPAALACTPSLAASPLISFGMSSYGRVPGGRDQGQGGGDALARARASNAQANSSAGGHVGSIGWQAPEVIADRVSLEGGQGPSATAGGAERCGGKRAELSVGRMLRGVIIVWRNDLACCAM